MKEILRAVIRHPRWWKRYVYSHRCHQQMIGLCEVAMLKIKGA